LRRRASRPCREHEWPTSRTRPPSDDGSNFQAGAIPPSTWILTLVFTADGKTAGKGELGEGKYKDGWCEFPFTISDVQSESKFYSVEVSHRRTIEYTQEELEKGVSHSLGS
jgi:hypothetical protein